MINRGELLRFALVGLTTTALYFGLLLLQVEAWGVSITLASSIACVIAITYNYLLHYSWTFSADAPHGIVLVRYLLMSVGSVLINASVMHYGVPLLGLHYRLVQVLAAAAMIAWTLCMSALWVYRN
jgi:putative flippase GtrA